MAKPTGSAHPLGFIHSRAQSGRIRQVGADASGIPLPNPVLRADSRWRRLAPWIGLGLALCWTVAVRIPLILNAEVHLDSDLAVDGLTLLEAVQGRWRWHYPGTPHMGIGPVFLSWIQGKIWGVTPITLVSGGTVAHLLIVLATFALAGASSGARSRPGA